MRSKILYVLMEAYVYTVCVLVLICGFCLLPIASLFDSGDSIDNIF